MENEFDILAAKVLADEATAEESARLEGMLAANPALRTELDELQSAWALVKQAGPLSEALNAPPTTPPPERVKNWQAAVARKRSAEAGCLAEARSNNQQQGAFANLRLWFRRASSKARHSVRAAGTLPYPKALAIGLVCLAVIVAGLLSNRFWEGRVGPRAPSSANSSATVAYLVAREGTFQLYRDGKAITAGSSISLRTSDELRLPPQVSVSVISSNGAVQLEGPRTISVRELVLNPRAWQGGVQTNAENPVVGAALFHPRRELFALLNTMRSGGSIPIYCPVGFTANLTPPILWKSEPGKAYDIVITDELSPAAAPFRHKKAVSPVEFTNAWPSGALLADGLYRLRIAESGKSFTASELTFRTLPQPATAPSGEASERLIAAYGMLSGTSPRIGDALALLLNLPPEAANSELALRLKLYAFGQLGYENDFRAAANALSQGR